MVRALFDTNILIDYLKGIVAARDELQRYDVKAISIVTWMEVMAGAPPEVEAATRAFLDGFQIIAVDNRIAEYAVAIRKSDKVKLPDAIIRASAAANDMLVVTRNTKDFPSSDPGVRVPYLL